MQLLLTIIAQFVLSFVFGFILPYSLGIGNGWELVVIPLGMSLAMILPAIWLLKMFHWRLVVGPIVGSFLGAAFLTEPSVAYGFTGLLFPLGGAFIGFYSNYFLLKGAFSPKS